jgi:hypothetical protein
MEQKENQISMPQEVSCGHCERKMATGSSRRQRGFTLLEYCAGAAVLIAVVYVGMEQFGAGLKEYFEALGAWAKSNKPTIKTP